MNTVTKLQPIFIIGTALLGLLLGYSTGFGNVSVDFVEPFLMVLLFFVFLSVDGKKLKEAFKNIRFTATAVITNFIWTPVFAFLLGILFFREYVDDSDVEKFDKGFPAKKKLKLPGQII